MASTYSTSLQLQLISNGEQSGVWGTTTNTNWNLIEQAVAGVQAITMSNANYTLSVLNGVSDESRNMVLVVGGSNSAIRQIIAPLVPKVYMVSNNTSGGYAITVGGATGTLVTVPNGTSVLVYCDGTNFYSGVSGVAGNFTIPGNNTVAGNESIGGNLSVTGTTTLTGTATAPTPTTSDNTTKIATTAFVTTAVTNATGSLGTMSTQNANNVNITGGSITGTSFTGNITGNASGSSGSCTGNAATVTNGVYTTNFTGSNQSLASSGFQKFPGGLTIAWGSITTSNPGGGNNNFYVISGSASLPVTFTNVYQATVGFGTGNVFYGASIGISSLTTTAISVAGSSPYGNGTPNVTYLVIGTS